MVDSFLREDANLCLEYANLLLQDGFSKLLAENGDTFVTDGSSALAANRYLTENLDAFITDGGTEKYLLEYANILLQDDVSKLLAENNDAFVTDGSALLITDVYLLEAAAAITETIIAMEFPMLYRTEPVTAKELSSRVSGATITKVANTFPQELLKAGKAKDLRSRWA